MKKQLFSLVMMLAIVVLAGTSAMAQNGLTVGTAYWHLPGSTHGVQVADHGATSTYTWAIRTSACDGTDNGAAVGASITTGGYQATITYTDAATGMYRITCTEASTSDNLCSTIRVFYTAIMNVDVVVTASNLAGGTLTAAELSTCNDYSSLNGTLGNLVGNTDALDNTNNLNGWQSATWYNTRYANVVLSVADLSGCPVAAAPTASAFGWQFNYTVAGTNYASPDNFIAMQAPINIVGGAAADITYTDATDETSTITVKQGVTAFTIPLRSYIRWGLTNVDQDQDLTYTVDTGSAVLDGSDTDVLYDDGKEPSDAAHIANNVSASQHIDASPATPRITIND